MSRTNICLKNKGSRESWGTRVSQLPISLTSAFALSPQMFSDFFLVNLLIFSLLRRGITCWKNVCWFSSLYADSFNSLTSENFKLSMIRTSFLISNVTSIMGQSRILLDLSQKVSILKLYSYTKRTKNKTIFGPVGWSCRIHRLHLCRGIRIPSRVSWIRHQAIWWWCSSNDGVLGNAEYPFTAIIPRSTLARSGRTWKGLIYCSNRTKLCS